MRIWAIGSSIAIGILMGIVVAWPVAADEYGGGAIQSYAADRSLDNGTVVRLTGEDENRVTVATQAEMQNMFGVTMDGRQLPVRISNESLENQVYVAVSGTYNVLVSTQGGPIEPGDHVTLSSIDGIAMKAGTEESTVLGRAVTGFDGSDATRGTTTLMDVDGNESETVRLGTIPVTIEIQSNPNEESTTADLPEMLQRVGQAVAEREVSPVRIYLSMAITAVTLIIALVVLYAGVRNSIISIGRNPMSKKSIFRALLEVMLTSFLIVIIGLFAVYLLLRL